MKNKWIITIDLIMVVLFLMLYKNGVFSLGFHELIGLLVFVIALIHLVSNRKTFVSAAKKFGKINTRAKIRYIVDVIFLIDFVLIIVTGIMISLVLFNFGYTGIWMILHNFLSAFALILAGIHCGLEWDLFSAMIGKTIKMPTLSKPLVMIFAILILVGGAYSMVDTSFGDWLTGPFTYDFDDYHDDAQGNGVGHEKADNGTKDNKTADKRDNANLINFDSLTFDNIFKFGKVSFATIMTILEYVLIIGFFGVIFGFINQALKKSNNSKNRNG